MKNKTLYIILGLLLLLVIVVYLYLYFSRKKAAGSGIIKKQINSILFIGDSNTAANFSYADQLSKSFPNIKIKKIASNGAKTDWMLSSLQTELKNNHYDVVVILGGSNDIYGTNSIRVAKTSLDEMYKLAHQNGSEVVAVSPPNKKFYTGVTPGKEALLIELIAWIKANQNKDIFINFRDMTNDKSLFSASDGYLHPQSYAHTLLMTELTRQLKLNK